MTMTTKATIVAAAICAISGTAQAQQVVKLSQLAGGQGLANDINNRGEIVGQSMNAFGVVTAVRWDASGAVSDLGLLDGDTVGWGEAINNNGEIVGYSENEATGLRRGVVWDGRGGIVNMHDAIGSTGPSIPWDINDSGVVSGQASINPGFAKGFVWDQTNPAVVVGSDGYMGGANYGINSAGELVGSGFFFGDPDDATYVVPDGRGGYESRSISPMGFYFAQARAINDSGLIVGHTTYASNTTGWNAVIYTGDSEEPVTNLGTLTGLDNSEALAVNNSGMIVGYAWDGTGAGLDPRAWAWVDGTMYDLNELLSEDADLERLLRATGVNDNGDIVGWARGRGGDLEAFVIKGFTAPEPCVADFNGDGSLNFFDVSAFLAAFTEQEPAADLNGDRTWNFFDVSAFLNAFNAGCP